MGRDNPAINESPERLLCIENPVGIPVSSFVLWIDESPDSSPNFVLSAVGREASHASPLARLPCFIPGVHAHAAPVSTKVGSPGNAVRVEE